MSHIILTGATGLVGNGVLHALIVDSSVSRVSVLSRRPVPQAKDQPKVTTYIHSDFLTYDKEALAPLLDAKGCVWALGKSTATVKSKEEYHVLTHDYPLAFLEAFAKAKADLPKDEVKTPEFNFVFVSGEGATTSPSFMSPLFARVKGATEASLLAFHKTHPGINVFSARPGGVDGTAHTEIVPFITNDTGLMMRAARQMVHGIGKFMPSMMSPTRELGRSLVMLATGDGKPRPEGEKEGISGEGRTVNNAYLRKMAGL